MSNLLQAALEYASYGWRVHPLHHITNGRCSCGRKCGKSAGKHPLLESWGEKATTDEDTIVEWWDNSPDANLGVVFGEQSGIIDIECDGPEFEKRLTEIFGGEFPACPTFTSGRGKHRIFAWTADLPCQDKDGFKIGGIEFRTGSKASGQQSVFPPSTHYSGKKYEWLIHPSEVDPPTIPPRVMDRIWEELGFARESLHQSSKSPEEWEKIIDGVGEGSRNDTAASLIGKILRSIDVHDNEAIRVQYNLIVSWNQRNSPPLDENELRRVFTSILRAEQKRRTNDEFESSFSKFVDVQDPGKPSDPIRTVGDWKLVMVESNPKVFRLYSPLWSSMTKEGFIELTASQFKSSGAIEIQALEQAGVWVESDFKKVWNGTSKKKGLAAQLMESAETIEAPTEEHRINYVAQKLLKEFDRAGDFDEERGHSRSPQRMPDGSIVFDFQYILDKHCMGAEAIKRTELSKVIRMGSGGDYQPRNKNGRREHLKRIPAQGVEHLNWIVYKSPNTNEQLAGEVGTKKSSPANSIQDHVSTYSEMAGEVLRGTT